jgi:hypothetical protein
MSDFDEMVIAILAEHVFSGEKIGVTLLGIVKEGLHAEASRPLNTRRKLDVLYDRDFGSVGTVDVKTCNQM